MSEMSQHVKISKLGRKLLNDKQKARSVLAAIDKNRIAFERGEWILADGFYVRSATAPPPLTPPYKITPQPLTTVLGYSPDGIKYLPVYFRVRYSSGIIQRGILRSGGIRGRW